MLLRKKVVTFARLGGKLSVDRFPPVLWTKLSKKESQSTWNLCIINTGQKIPIQFHGKFTALKLEKW